MKDIPWTIKYRPKRIEDIVNQKNAKLALIKYLNNFPNVEKKALFFYGPAGTGKTALVQAAARELGYELIEVNASDKRDFKSVKEIIGNALKNASLFGRKKLILIDELDGITGLEDRGGVKALVEVIKDCKNPVILIANDPWKDKLRPLRNLVEMIEFKPISPRNGIPYLEKICEAEGIKADRAVLRALIERNNGDLRSAVNDLQTLASIKKIITPSDLEVLGYRDKEITVFDALVRVFKTMNVFTAITAFNNVPDMELDEVILWIAENIPREYLREDEIAEAYERISRADVFMGRIIRRQYFGFLRYANTLATAGVALAKKQVYRKFTKYSPPTRLKKIGKIKRYRELLITLAKRLSQKIHVSSRKAFEIYIPLIEYIYEKNKKMFERLRKQLKIDRYEIEALNTIVKLKKL